VLIDQSDQNTPGAFSPGKIESMSHRSVAIAPMAKGWKHGQFFNIAKSRFPR
jgi:hypothetical protein